MGKENFGYRVGEHPEDDDFSDVLDNFDKIEVDNKSKKSSTSSPSSSSSKADVWDTNRGQGKKDKSRIWGTEEYFKRVEKPRDEWDTGLEDFGSMSRRIQRNIKADAEKIRLDANKIRLDAERMAADARRAATRVRQTTSTRMAQTRLQGQDDILKSFDFTAKTKKKPKRRWKVSGKGITVGGSIFWCFIIYTCLFDNDDDKDTKAKVADTKTSNDVVETVKATYNNLKPEAQALIDKAKDEFNKLDRGTDMDIAVTTGQEVTQDVVDSSDPYKQNDDRYGSIEDKW